jgi:hypothetical protein
MSRLTQDSDFHQLFLTRSLKEGNIASVLRTRHPGISVTEHLHGTSAKMFAVATLLL